MAHFPTLNERRMATQGAARDLYRLLFNYNPQFPMGAGQYNGFCAIMERLQPLVASDHPPFERQRHPQNR